MGHMRIIGCVCIIFVVTASAQLLSSSEESSGQNIFQETAARNARRLAISKRIFHQQKRDVITFPTESTPNIITPCDNSTFCKDPTISTEVLDEAFIRKLSKYREFFVSDELIPIIEPKSGGTEEYLCDVKEEVARPNKAQTISGDWVKVINTEGFEQGIRVETCVGEKTQCRMTDSFPNGYKTECRQKYMARQLITKNAKNVPETNLFRLPSCCECILIHP